MKLPRNLFAATVLFFGAATLAAYGDDGLRQVALTTARVVAVLGTGSTAQTNLGLGTASLQPIGTSGPTVPLLNGANNWSNTQNITGGASPVTGTPAGIQTFFDGTANYTFSYNPGVAFLPYNLNASVFSFGSGPVRILTNLQIGSSTASTVSNGETALAKITASGTAPGAGFLKLAAVAGTNTGTCKIIAYAGTSTTPSTLLDNIGTGC